MSFDKKRALDGEAGEARLAKKPKTDVGAGEENGNVDAATHQDAPVEVSKHKKDKKEKKETKEKKEKHHKKEKKEKKQKTKDLEKNDDKGDDKGKDNDNVPVSENAAGNLDVDVDGDINMNGDDHSPDDKAYSKGDESLPKDSGSSSEQAKEKKHKKPKDKKKHHHHRAEGDVEGAVAEEKNTANPTVKSDDHDHDTSNSKGDEETVPKDTEPSSEPVKEKKHKKSKDKKKHHHHRKEDDAGNAGAEGAAQPAINGDASSNGNASSGYHQTQSLSAVPESEIESFLKTNFITIDDPTTSSPSNRRPILNFGHLPDSPLLSKSPFATFKAPTPIQAASWPYSLSGRDVIGIAETGSGKTYAFALPCVEALHARPKPATKKGGAARARAVIVSPTRELAMQTHASISTLAALVGLSAVCLYGGASKDEQRSLLRRSSGADIVVATPGRLKDFLSEGAVSLADAAFIVLDEADRMLDKGFEEDIKQILGQCPAPAARQTLMFTATWPASVRGLAESFMVDPVKVIISEGGDPTANGGHGGIELQANHRITQTVEVVEPRGKEQRLLQILRKAQQGRGARDRILVFCLYKKETTRVEEFLSRRGVEVVSIHGDLRQEQRTRSLEAFKAGTTSVLLATDVAARGLDIPEVKLVVNLTFPLTIEDYVHRIGRTGRAGKTGHAITLFTEQDKAHSGELINVLKAANQPVPEDLLKFGTTVKRKTHDSYGAFFKDVDMNQKGTKITFD